MDKLHKNITVSGLVQGVGFRFSCSKMAKALGLKGYVRNLYNDGVYVEVEGAEPQINKLIDWCKKGSALARVSDIEVTMSSLKHYSYFEIKH